MTVRISTLANGLRVVTEAMDRVETVSMGVWVGVGARHEQVEVNGVSHLLEHMAFKGTRRRSALQIATEIEDVGGHINAWTSRETTAYYVKLLSEDTALGVDLLSDILQHSVFDEDELAREREVILQEIGQAQDTPDDIIFDHFQAAAFPDQPLGRPVLGDPSIVAGLPRQSLVAFMQGNYHGPRMVFAAAGKLDHERIVAQVEAAFGDLGQAAAAQPEPARYHGGDHREKRRLDQLHLLIGLPGIGLKDPDYFAAMVHATILGGGMSSRLFQEVREKRGLVYSIHSYNAAYEDAGVYGIYAGTGADRVVELVPVVFDELARMADGVSAEELARGKTQMKSALLMSLESPGSRCDQLAQQMLIFGRPLDVSELTEKIEAVDDVALGAVSRRMLDGALTTAAIGPIGKLESHDKMATRLGVTG
jgi:predicted Zn-dependent peptidase